MKIRSLVIAIPKWLFSIDVQLRQLETDVSMLDCYEFA
jgi:hypothetical protein